MAPTVIEHVVLFKVKEDTSSERTAAQVSAWRGLRDLDEVLELTAGPVLESLSSGFTHALYGRYKDKAALRAYDVHPDHQRVVKFGLEVVEDVLAVDWEASPEATPEKAPAAFRIVLLKPKDGVQQEDLEPLAEAVTGYKALLPPPHDTSLGANINPARGQGHKWGFVLRFQSVQALEKFKSDPRQLQLLEQKLAPLADSVIVLDLAKEE